jgi:hypothetical protein
MCLRPSSSSSAILELLASERQILHISRGRSITTGSSLLLAESLTAGALLVQTSQNGVPTPAEEL